MSKQAEPALNEGNAGPNQAPRDLRLPGALVRTALSSEQTLMSWVRTSLSLFTFGFSIAKFFQYLAEQSEAGLSENPRRLGIALIFVGILALILAIFEHVQTIRILKKQGLPPDSRSFLPIGSAAVLLVIGIIALVTVFLGWQL
jgi:putative membrane protein